MITIKRQTGFIGMGLGMSIKVDDEKVGRISERDTQELAISGDKATIKVTQLGIKSNALEVSGGEHLILETRPWVKYAIIIMFLSIFFVSLISYPGILAYKFFIYILIFSAYLGSFYFFDAYELKLISSSTALVS